jgi:hypothetical protein
VRVVVIALSVLVGGIIPTPHRSNIQVDGKGKEVFEEFITPACSLIFCRQRSVEVDFNNTGQGPEPLHPARIRGLQALWMTRNVAGKKAEKEAEFPFVFTR